MDRYICVHGHFYQPPRENPWLEAIERQPSAYPYHDWNARITAECYAPNAASRILDDRERITRIVNNYASMSFNFGPTLLGWLRHHAPDVYRVILDADQVSRERFSGHGSALAQAYNHTILPLARPADARTQVAWGLADFRRHFGREAEGMWLPETAVDLPSLDLLAEAGVRFTILAPHQAARIRPLAGGPWEEVRGGRIDPTRPYLQRLRSGRSIALYFYDGPISRAVAFERLLASGERFANRLAEGFSAGRERAQLVHIATDGETYGHHHRHGEMALSYALHHIQASGSARITNYGEFLEMHPPEYEVEILEDTSWSCAHGLERWKSDCGCSTGGEPGWHQAWRAPLRDTLDWLRDRLADRFEAGAGEFLTDPGQAREGYIAVLLERSEGTIQEFLSRYAARTLDDGERTRTLKLLEMERHAMLMYTSCGWFFNELSGIETTQVLQYAGRAIQLAEKLLGESLEPEFLVRLEEARSNLPEWQDGRRIYERTVRAAMVDLPKVGAHFAVTSLFEPYERSAGIYCYTVDTLQHETARAGQASLAVGRAVVRSDITLESAEFSYGVMHLGDHNLSGGVRQYLGDQAYGALEQEVMGAFERADFPEVFRLLDRHFQASTYSLRSLFRDEQQRILDRILEPTLTEAESVYRKLNRDMAPVMRFLHELEMPVPSALQRAAEWVVNVSLRSAFTEVPLNLHRVQGLLAEARGLGITLETAGLGFALTGTLERLAREFAAEPESLGRLEALHTGGVLVTSLPFEVNIWTVQNVYYRVLARLYREQEERSAAGDPEATAWVRTFRELGEHLGVAVGAA